MVFSRKITVLGRCYGPERPAEREIFKTPVSGALDEGAVFVGIRQRPVLRGLY
jgi:hypothetical protein